MKKSIFDRVAKVHEDFLIVEIDVLQRGENFKLPSEIYPIILEVIAEARKTTPEEIEAINQRNVLKMISDDPNLKNMKDLIT